MADNLDYWYDAQIRRYLTQFMRIFSGFKVSEGVRSGSTYYNKVPVRYADMSRMVAHILKKGSENMVNSTPFIACSIGSLLIARDRVHEPMLVDKIQIAERQFDSTANAYATSGNTTSTPGNLYSTDRYMPVPYNLTMQVDIWSGNTDQKLQLLEQILVLFNPSLEMQTTDNFIDWTSITVVHLENVQWSSRSVPVGVDSEIDIATLSFSVPIYISPPTKVRKMGVITNIITSMFDEENGTIEDGVSRPQLNAYDDTSQPGTSTDERGTRIDSLAGGHSANVNFAQWGVYVSQSNAQLVANGMVGVKNWREIFTALPGVYAAGVSRIFLTSNDNNKTITGTFAVNPLDEGQIAIDFDTDSFPADTIITSSCLLYTSDAADE